MNIFYKSHPVCPSNINRSETSPGKAGMFPSENYEPDYKRDTVNWIESVLQFQTCLNVHREMKVWFSITHSASVTLQHFNQHHEDQPSQFCCGSKRGFSLAEGRTGSGEAAAANPYSSPRCRRRVMEQWCAKSPSRLRTVSTPLSSKRLISSCKDSNHRLA